MTASIEIAALTPQTAPAQVGRGCGVEFFSEKYPCRRGLTRQFRRARCGEARLCHQLSRGRGERLDGEAGSGNHRDRHAAGDVLPAPPAVKLGKVVAAHQPNEACFWEAALQGLDRVDRVTGLEGLLDRRHFDAWV